MESETMLKEINFYKWLLVAFMLLSFICCAWCTADWLFKSETLFQYFLNMGLALFHACLIKLHKKNYNKLVELQKDIEESERGQEDIRW